MIDGPLEWAPEDPEEGDTTDEPFEWTPEYPEEGDRMYEPREWTLEELQENWRVDDEWPDVIDKPCPTEAEWARFGAYLEAIMENRW